MLEYPPYLYFPLLSMGIDVRKSVLDFGKDFVTNVARTVYEQMTNRLGTCPYSKQFIGYVVQSGLGNVFEAGYVHSIPLMTNLGVLDYITLYNPEMLHTNNLLDGPSFVLYTVRPNRPNGKFFTGWLFLGVNHRELSWFVSQCEQFQGTDSVQRMANNLNNSQTSPCELLRAAIPGMKDLGPMVQGGTIYGINQR